MRNKSAKGNVVLNNNFAVVVLTDLSKLLTYLDFLKVITPRLVVVVRLCLELIPIKTEKEKPSLTYHKTYLEAKREDYGFNRKTVAYIYSYLKNRKQGVKINGTQSYLGDTISIVPQG